MSDFLHSCLEVYKKLTGVTKLRKVSTPFITEPSSSTGPSGMSSAQEAALRRKGVLDKFTNAGAPRKLNELIARTAEFTSQDLDHYGRSFEVIFGDAYRLFPVSMLEGPKIWYGQLSEVRRNKHDDWVRSIAHVQGLALSDPNWKGASYGAVDRSR